MNLSCYIPYVDFGYGARDLLASDVYYAVYSIPEDDFFIARTTAGVFAPIANGTFHCVTPLDIPEEKLPCIVFWDDGGAANTPTRKACTHLDLSMICEGDTGKRLYQLLREARAGAVGKVAVTSAGVGLVAVEFKNASDAEVVATVTYNKQTGART